MRRFVNGQCRGPTLFGSSNELAHSFGYASLSFAQRAVFCEVSVELARCRESKTPDVFHGRFEFGACRIGGRCRGIPNKRIETLAIVEPPGRRDLAGKQGRDHPPERSRQGF